MKPLALDPDSRKCLIDCLGFRQAIRVGRADDQEDRIGISQYLTDLESACPKTPQQISEKLEKLRGFVGEGLASEA